jgi:hypothetical protein
MVTRKICRLAGAKVILPRPNSQTPLKEHAEQIRQLAAEPCVGLVNSLAALKAGIVRGLLVPDLMAQVNHPNTHDHSLGFRELAKWVCRSPTKNLEGRLE